MEEQQLQHYRQKATELLNELGFIPKNEERIFEIWETHQRIEGRSQFYLSKKNQKNRICESIRVHKEKPIEPTKVADRLLKVLYKKFSKGG